jgi:hypothetical protein
MREYYKTTIHGLIKHGEQVATCPRCNARQGLTVCGEVGDPALIVCPQGHEFRLLAPFDGAWLLQQIAADPRRTTSYLTYGELPDRP